METQSATESYSVTAILVSSRCGSSAVSHVYTDPFLIPSELELKHTAWEPCGVIVLWTYKGIGQF